MKLWFFLVLFFFFFLGKNDFLNVWAQEWKRSERKFDFLDEEIKFYNRSAAADLSRYPTSSVFLIMDNMNIARASYRLSKITGSPGVETTYLAVEKFHYTLVQLIKIISSNLLAGNLPLVEDELLNHSYLEKNWKELSLSIPKEVLSCRRIKKMTPLHSNLSTSKPDRFLLEKMAQEMEDLSQVFSSCENLSREDSLETSLMEFKLSTKDLKKFNLGRNFLKEGFRFWYSLKIYLSWAWRYSREARELSFPFDQIIRSSDLEEMLLFFSSGPQSMKRPECSDEDLSLDELRSLTKKSHLLTFDDLDFFTSLSEPIIDSLSHRKLPLLEEDALRLTESSDKEEWSKNFMDNLLTLRGYQKMKLNQSLDHLVYLTRHLEEDVFKRRILKDLEASPVSLQEFFSLCTEYQFAENLRMMSLKKEIQFLRENPHLKKIVSELYETEVTKLLSLYEPLSVYIHSLCEDLQNKNTWKNFEADPEFNALWYKKIIFKDKKIKTKVDVPSGHENKRPFFKVSSSDFSCENGPHCARIYLADLVSLAESSKSLAVILGTSEASGISEAPSSSMGNPYGTSVACGAYDPWAKKNKILYEFFHDVTQSLAFGMLPTPIYISAELDEKKLTSFSTLLKEGKVFYDPNFDPKKIKLSLISDLGPLLGIPCALSFSRLRHNPFDYYSFMGITFSACQNSARSEVQVSLEDLDRRDPKFYQTCASCALNLQTISPLAGLSPAIRMSSFLLRGVFRLINNLKDPQDLPRSWSISTQLLSLNYRHFGKISESCAKNLLQSKTCIPKKCESKMWENLTSRYRISPVNAQYSCRTKTGHIKVKECPELIQVDLNNNPPLSTTCPLEERR